MWQQIPFISIATNIPVGIGPLGLEVRIFKFWNQNSIKDEGTW
jgi:hypothetical protein